MITSPPPLPLNDVFDDDPRCEPHAWILPPSRREFDAERIVATYQRTRDTLAHMRCETPRQHMTTVNELVTLIDAYRWKWAARLHE